jgi:hypothetical protein
MREFSLLGRCARAVAAVGLITTSLAAPASAVPLTSAGFGAVGPVFLAQMQQVPRPGPVGGGAAGVRPAAPGWRPGPGHGPGPGPGFGHGPSPGSGGQWAYHHHHGGHWRNGVWVPAVAFGILGAAAAAAMFGAPPEPGMCWYYDDPYQTTGHWDYC